MRILDKITITELARLTMKSRPTIYKYINSYENNRLDEIPYFFITLFEDIEKGISKKKIESKCFSHFGKHEDETQNIINFINEHKAQIDCEKLMDFLKEIKND